MSKRQGEERRVFSSKVELREAAEGKVTLAGLVVPYEKLSDDLGGWRERIQRGAFSGSISGGDEIVGLYDHQFGHLLGRRSNETLRVEERDDGVHIEIDMPKTSVANDVVELVRRGDLKGMSVGFWKAEANWIDTDQGMVRVVTKASIFDASIVTWPAYPDTEVAERSFKAIPKPDDGGDEDGDRRRRALAAVNTLRYSHLRS